VTWQEIVPRVIAEFREQHPAVGRQGAVLRALEARGGLGHADLVTGGRHAPAGRGDGGIIGERGRRAHQQGGCEAAADDG